MSKKEKIHYVNNQEFLEALITYKKKCDEAKEAGKPEPKIPDYIGMCFWKIAEGLSMSPNFIGYSYREEMVYDGVENCLMYFRNFDPEKTNSAFSYFTQIIWYAFLRRISKEKKQQYIKYKMLTMSGLLDDIYQEDAEHFNDDSGLQTKEVYDNMYEFISEFERKEKEKKAKKNSAKSPTGVEKFLED